MRFRALWAPSLAICGSLGCAANTLDAEALGAAGAKAEDKVESTAEPLSGPPIPLNFAQLRYPENPSLPNPVLTADQWVCALGSLTGDMQSGEVVVDISTSNQWYIHTRGDAGDAVPSAVANCVPLAGFIGGTTKWLSGKFRNTNESSSCPEFVIRTDTWWGDAATFLNSIHGGMFGGGEKVDITQSNDPFGPSWIAARTCQGTLSIYARSLFVGIPGSGKQAKFRGPTWPFVGSADQVGEYAVDRRLVSMARTDEAFCDFTLIQGAFAGNGEYAEIIPIRDAFNQEVWALRTGSLQGVLPARARCYMFDQT